MPNKNLNDFTPIKQGTQPSFVSEENHRKHIGSNPNGLHCRQYHVDGTILTAADGKKCDYLLVNDDGKDAYFIELKGKKITDAVEQLEAAIETLKGSLDGYHLFRRIIANKPSTHDIKGSTVTLWKRKCRGEETYHGQKNVVIADTQHTDIMVR